MRKKANHSRWLLCVLFVLAAKQTAFAHVPPTDSAVQATIIYVDDDADGANDGSTWANAYNNLQDAIIAASAGDEIRVAQGIYKPDQGTDLAPGDREATFRLINGITLAGGYAGLGEPDPNAQDVAVYETILSGDLNGDDIDVQDAQELSDAPSRIDNSLHVVTIEQVDLCVLYGFIIRDGHATDGSGGGGGGGNFPVINGGGGLKIEDSSPFIQNCTFIHNWSWAGGAVFIPRGNPEIQSSLEINNCKFIVNASKRYGGALSIEMGRLSLTNCEFVANRTEDGGAIYSVMTDISLSECIFRENRAVDDGGGLSHANGNIHLIGCTFVSNSALPATNNQGGAIEISISSGYKAVATDCLFRNNSATYGGAIQGSFTELRNCRFTGNVAYYRGGAIDGRETLTCESCLFEGNKAMEHVAVVQCLGALLFTNCTIAENRSPDGYTFLATGGHGAPQANVFTNCIIRGANPIFRPGRSWLIKTLITYCNIQGGWPGEGNIDIDPSFAQPGYWDPNGTPDDPNDDFWIDGDYHLKSQVGRWDPASQSWVVDNVTSPCIDAGDPNSPVAFEPFPNGGIINMGAYGGTTEASLSPSGIHAKYGGGSGTTDDPYLIYTAEQMNAIGGNLDDWDKHFKLMADIDLSSYTGAEFNIIGISNRNSFSGVFDGNGHTISNFCYYLSNKDYIGLFRYVSGQNAQIKDLGLIAPIILAGTGSDVGSLAGCISSGTIKNCYVEGGSVAGKKKIGGLVGYNQGSLKDCSSTCSVSGNEQIGGLVGYNSDEIINCYAGGEIFGRQDVGGLSGTNQGTIKNSSAAGTVGGGGDYVGGLVGSNSGLLLSCSAGGEVFGNVQVGGLVGNSTDLIIDCYAAGSVSGNKNVGGLVGRAYASIINCYAAGGVSGTSNAGGLVGQGLENYITYGRAINSFWNVETSGQLTSDGGTGKTTAQMQNTGTFMDAGWDFVAAPDGPSDVWAEPEGGGYPVLCWQLSPSSKLPAFSGGTGAPDDPYLISTADELNSIGHNPRLMSAHFKLINDIDLAGMEFYIIGDQWYPFSGVFNGSGHTISNFSYTSSEASYVGLFGYVAGGQIKDLGLNDSYISIDRGLFHGGLVGYFEGGTITNCYVEDCRISGNDFAGGLIGISSAELNRSGTITNCYVTGSVAGDDNVGGLVGSNGGDWSRPVAISNCYVTGSVSGDDDVGGLVGSNIGTITDCYSIADVNGSEHVGGLIGTGNNFSFGHGGRIGSRIERCYVAGRMSGDEYVGGLAGQNDGEIALSFWNNETSGQLSISDGNGRTTAEMQTAGTFLNAGWDFVDETTNGTEDIWWISEGQDYPRLWWELTDNGK